MEVGQMMGLKMLEHQEIIQNGLYLLAFIVFTFFTLQYLHSKNIMIQINGE